MFSAWKKEVCAGSRPLGPLGMVTEHGAMTPALAEAGLTYSTMTSFTSARSTAENTNPMLPTMYG